jgi:arabinofuranosyltransferase
VVAGAGGWLSSVASLRCWLCWLAIWAAGAGFWGLVLGHLPNPRGRWHRTTGVPAKPGPLLDRGILVGQPLAPERRALSYLGIRFSGGDRPPGAWIQLMLLSGQARPTATPELTERLLIKWTVRAARISKNRFLRLDLGGPRRALQQGGYLLVRALGPPRAPALRPWLDPAGQGANPAAETLLYDSGAIRRQQRLAGQLVLEAGSAGRQISLWSSLQELGWGWWTLALGAVVSLGLVLLLAPRPRRLLSQMAAALGRPPGSLVPAEQVRQWLPAVVLLLVIYLVFVIRGAWLCDDIYITLRTVHNFVHGHGLTWNPDERVQAYTHPLWMFVLAGTYLALDNAYWAALLPSLVFSLLTALLVAFRLARTPLAAVLALALLLLSKAFTEFSTSGLENPLTHLLLALFLVVLLQPHRSRGSLLLLLLLAALLGVNRADTLLLVLPALVLAIREHRRRAGLGALELVRLGILGLAPLWLWELFSLFYYGSLIPNTAFAKLNTGIPPAQMARQGLTYLLNSLAWDPLTLTAVLGCLAAPLASGDRRLWWVAAGAWLYVAWVTHHGGCFMSGRMLSGPLLLAVVLWARLPLTSTRQLAVPLAALATLALTTRSGPLSVEDRHHQKLTDSGIIDERRFYFDERGLMTFHRDKRFPARPSAREVPELDHVCGFGGIRGFASGSRGHLIDTCALSDAFLGRLPAIGAFTGDWRIGHFDRALPVGYWETIRSGQTLLRTPELARLYDRLQLVIRGDLLDPQRWAETLRLVTGAGTSLQAVYRTDSIELSQLNRQAGRGLPLREGGVDVVLARVRQARRLMLELGSPADYHLALFLQDRRQALRYVKARGHPGRMRVTVMLEPKKKQPGEAPPRYDRLRVVPAVGPGEFFLGRVTLK